MTLYVNSNSEHTVKKGTKSLKNTRRVGGARPQNSKRGKKTLKDKIELDRKLHDYFDQDGMTPWRASIDCHCGYEYAVKKFDEFGLILVEAEEETWIERQDRVRKRALEGLSIQIQDAKDLASSTRKRLEKTRDIQESLIDNMVENVQNTELGSILKDTLGRIDSKVVMAIYKQLTDDLNMYRNYGTLVENIQQKLLSTLTFKAELQMQYDGIEIEPPASAVLEAELEKAIAAKNELFQVTGPQPDDKT